MTAPRREDAAGVDDPLMAAIAFASHCGLKDEIRSAAVTQVAQLMRERDEATAALSTAERDAKRWRFARTILHVVSTGPSGGYYLTSGVADGMDVQAVSPDGFVDQFAAARVPSGGET